jgi:hypothetical protein
METSYPFLDFIDIRYNEIIQSSVLTFVLQEFLERFLCRILSLNIKVREVAIKLHNASD